MLRSETPQALRMPCSKTCKGPPSINRPRPVVWVNEILLWRKKEKITMFSKKINGFVENIFKHAMREFSLQIKLLPKFFTKCWLRLSLADKSLCVLLYTEINLEIVLSFTQFALTITSPELGEFDRFLFWSTFFLIFDLKNAMTSSYVDVPFHMPPLRVFSLAMIPLMPWMSFW